jgi:ketosteroid isomerase-like protein
MADHQEIVRAALDAFDRRDIKELMEYAHPDVELHKLNGEVLKGRDAAKEWAESFGFDELEGTAEIEEVRESGDQVVVLCQFVMRWKETGDIADKTPGALVFGFRDGYIVRWQAFMDQGEALNAAGLND